jgi:multiple sugar transport system substrate-binding protein
MEARRSMTDPITLRGITWDHPRGLDPLLALNEAYSRVAPRVKIEWQTRSLAGFGEDPLEELATSFDLLIIDHPFVGDAAASGAFRPLDGLVDPEVIVERERASVGPSHSSYLYAGHQWAFAIDAAAHVSAVHERFASQPLPTTWDEVIEFSSRLRREGAWMAIPMWPADLVVATYSIANGLGLDLFVGDQIVPRSSGAVAIELLKRLCDLSHPDALAWNPPAVLDHMRDDVVHYAPILFGYSNYSRSTTVGDRVVFGNIPTSNGVPAGSCLGGAGIAISTSCADPAAATAYASWITSADVQTGMYFRAGGQPGRSEAWTDDAVNAQSANFFRRTLPTLERAWVRPRIAGYQMFQKQASGVMVDYVTGTSTAGATLDALGELWRQTKARA